MLDRLETPDISQPPALKVRELYSQDARISSDTQRIIAPRVQVITSLPVRGVRKVAVIG